MSQSFLEIFSIVSAVTFFILIVGGFGYTLYKISQLRQQIDHERDNFKATLKFEQAECDKKIAFLELKVETLVARIIEILKDHDISHKGISLSVEAGGDVDIDGVVSGEGVNRSRPPIIWKDLSEDAPNPPIRRGL